MKKTLLSTVPFLALCALTASMAQAATTTNLTLTGQILPNACDVSVANGGVLALGDIPFASLNATGMTDVTPVANKLTTTVTCTNATLIALKATDNRSASVATETFPPALKLAPLNSYGLGVVNGKPIGAFQILPDASTPATVDGATARMISYYNGNFQPSSVGFSAAPNFPDYMIGASAPGIDSPLAGKIHVFGLNAFIGITDRNNLPTNQPINLDGSATLEVVYL
jgi:type 1 fimbria pilin